MARVRRGRILHRAQPNAPRMITGFFLQILLAVANFVVGLLPVYDLPAAVSSAISTAWGYMNALSFLLPMNTLLTVLGIAMVFHVSLLVWRLLHLIGGYLRGR